MSKFSSEEVIFNKENLQNIRKKRNDREKDVSFVIFGSAKWQNNQGIEMLLAPKENLDILVGATQIMVSLLSAQLWKCPLPPLNVIRRLKI